MVRADVLNRVMRHSQRTSQITGSVHSIQRSLKFHVKHCVHLYTAALIYVDSNTEAKTRSYCNCCLGPAITGKYRDPSRFNLYLFFESSVLEMKIEEGAAEVTIQLPNASAGNRGLVSY